MYERDYQYAAREQLENFFRKEIKDKDAYKFAMALLEEAISIAYNNGNTNY